jgi:predicted lipid carrier protein YhbT
MSHQVAYGEQFLQRLAATPQPTLQTVQASVRIDIHDDGGGERWLLRMDRGHVDVSRRNTRADAVISTDRAMFERLATGEANSLTATLRGRVRIDGDTRAVLAFERLLPSPPGRRTTLPPTDQAAKRAAKDLRMAGTATRTAKASTAIARMAEKERAR